MAETGPSTAGVDVGGGVVLPQVGFGVFQIPPDEAQKAVEDALAAGYRLIDTAAAYNNEAGVGAGIQASGVPRDEIVVTTKLRNGNQGARSTREAIERSRDALGVDHIDVYLIHWPSPARDLYRESWSDMEAAVGDGLVRSIGVSNFLAEHLERLLASTSTRPALNQLEVHPTFQQRELTALCEQHGIKVEAYSPLGQGADLGSPVVAGIARRLGATPAQVILAWHLAHGRVVIPKSVRPERMAENLDVTGLRLSDADRRAIDSLETGVRVGGDPATFEITQIR
ncbi:2,5-diketo-D-gluconic acid reductase [Frondihabitans sp. PAMC 28766]|uniref:aldo/keto reductase n=1 Tax=Frondihabitans sp. PAMC 28766 TaxID=1795630 RepID=UPI00078BD205|nr:aldo/keto reductase [Frondihabitans sp. PAMC 28766]AMM21419.1 2,5-diketo-D-gluconic acid reductase [Frondihabitans sp. PAMC 28766]